MSVPDVHMHTCPNNIVMLQFWKGEDLTSWLMKDQKALYDQHYGIHLKNDPDYSAALFQANPHHAPFLRAVFPTGEMFQPLARFMLKVSCRLTASSMQVCGSLSCLSCFSSLTFV